MSVELSTAAAEIVGRTTREQGLPEKIDDPVTLEKIARLIRTCDSMRGRP